MTGTVQTQQQPTAAQQLAEMNERTWLTMGNLAEMMSDYDKAMSCYESALRHNPHSVHALTQIAALCRGYDQFGKAVEYFKKALSIQENNGETWAAIGHCYLMMDSLQEAYHAYQQALYHLPNPKDPKLWYGIGILYDRYGSLEHAEEAFSAVMKMDPKFEKANEIYFRLGIIYKQQQKFDLSLQCFRYILHSPPRPLTESDIWFQTGHVYEQQKEYEYAKDAYERVLAENPDHAKVLQQLGWLYHQQNTSFSNQAQAINYLTRSLKSDSNDAQSWYLLGRCYMAEQNYSKAYEAYQQAVYRDARNPTFWCSIGVLYYQINQYRDALDAYSRAIRLNPYISEVWYDLGTLYESCNNQIQDALDAYQRAAELDPNNPHIKQRLELLRKSHSQNPQGRANVPTPQDVSNPNQYQNGNHAGPALNGNTSSGPGLTTGPSGPPNGLATYAGGGGAPHRVADDGHLPQHLPTLPSGPQENGTGPGRNLPMPDSADRKSSGSYPPYPPQPAREDVRIPDIGTRGGRAPTPSDRTQMNPILNESNRHPQQSMPETTPGHGQNSQNNLPSIAMRHSPISSNVTGPTEGSESIRQGSQTLASPAAPPLSRGSDVTPEGNQAHESTRHYSHSLHKGDAYHPHFEHQQPYFQTHTTPTHTEREDLHYREPRPSNAASHRASTTHLTSSPRQDKTSDSDKDNSPLKETRHELNEKSEKEAAKSEEHSSLDHKRQPKSQIVHEATRKDSVNHEENADKERTSLTDIRHNGNVQPSPSLDENSDHEKSKQQQQMQQQPEKECDGANSESRHENKRPASPTLAEMENGEIKRVKPTEEQALERSQEPNVENTQKQSQEPTHETKREPSLVDGVTSVSSARSTSPINTNSQSDPTPQKVTDEDVVMQQLTSEDVTMEEATEKNNPEPTSVKTESTSNQQMQEMPPSPKTSTVPSSSANNGDIPRETNA